MSRNDGVLADQLEVWGFDGDFIVFADGSLGFGLEAKPIDVSCWSSERINALSAFSGQWLNGLPTGVDIQFVQDICRGNKAALTGHQGLVALSASPVSATLANERVDHLAQLDKQGGLPRYGMKIFVRRPLRAPLVGRSGIFAKAKAFEQVTEVAMSAEVAQISALRDRIIQELTALGVTATKLSSDHVIDLMYEQWNPTREITRAPMDPDNVRSSIVFTDALLSERGFSIGDMHHRVISLKTLPESTIASMATVLSELPFDSRLFVSVQVPNQQKELESLQTQRRLAFSMARGKRTGVSDIESEAKFQDLETLLSEMIASGEKVFRVSVNVVLRSQSRETLDAQVTQTLSKIRELAGAEAMEESLASFEIFTELAIPNARARERMKRMKTSTLADFLPLFGPWAGHEKPSMLLRSRQGSLISFDPFASAFSNYNHIVSGGSGTGKSYFTNILLLQMLKEDPKIFIVDIGGSYKKMSDHLSGQYIALGTDSTVSINPFDLPAGVLMPDSHKIKFLVGLVESMTKEDGDERLPRLDRAEIEEAIVKVYESGKPPCLSVLREILLAAASVEVRRYGRILTPWCGDTPYGQFVDRPTTIELKRRIVSFDLKGMETYPDLQAVCLMIITDFVWREVSRDRSEKKFLIFDECWRLLESEAGSSFIGEVYRTFRKYNASCIGISQNIDDFAKSKVSAAILSNSAIKWILTQRGADQERLREVLQLNPNEMALVASLRQERGLYSEAFLIAGEERTVIAVGATPFEYWIATTDPRDLAKIDELRTTRGQDFPMDGILRGLAENFPRGVAAHQSSHYGEVV